MMKVLVVGIFIAAIPAIALAQANSDPKIPKQFTLTLTNEEVGQVYEAVKDLPWRVANPLMQKIEQQVRDQASPPKQDNKK